VGVRRVLVVAAVALLVPVVPSHGSPPPPKRRVVSVAYALPAGHTTGNAALLFGRATVTAEAQPDEDKVTVSAVDRGGRVALAIDLHRDGGTRRAVTCRPMTISVHQGTRVSATPVVGRCVDGRISTPAGGKVVLTFRKRPVVVKPKPVAPAAPVRRGAPPELRWAVLVGIDDYAGRTHSTVGAGGDVVAIRRALLQAGWRNDHILVVRERQATREGIRQALDWLAARSTPRTFSLFHFSGHVCTPSRGPCGDGHTWLWAQDNRFVSESELRTRMQRVRGYSWLDVAGCHAGAFALHSRQRLFTASSRASEKSYESKEWRQSVWTGLMWDRGFTDGQADDRGRARRATIGEMIAYGRAWAPKITRHGDYGPQHPVVMGGSGSWSIYAPPGG